jgi:hypothetical protein
MKILILILCLFVGYMIYVIYRDKVILLNLEPLKVRWLKLKMAATWVAVKFKTLKSKFTKKS